MNGNKTDRGDAAEAPRGDRTTVRIDGARAGRLAQALIFLVIASPVVAQESLPHDAWLIKGALVYDGSGRPGQQLDVRVVNGKIAKIAPDLQPRGDERIRHADGLVLAPGFIDPHSHHASSLARTPAPASVLAQGITTVVAGVDGKADAPVGTLFSQLRARPAAVNVAAFGAHNFYRGTVMGRDFRRDATDAEVERMRGLLIEDMKAGALGLSTGLEYDPAIYSSTAEIITLAREAAARGGRYSSHIRSEDVAFDAAIGEFLEVAEKARIPAHLSHIKLAMSARWGDAGKVLARLDAARAKGLQITADIYPYDAWQAPLEVLLPQRNFESRAAYEQVLTTIARPESIRIAEYSPDTSLVGKTLQEIAQARGVDAAGALQGLMQTAIARGTLPWGIVSNIGEDDIRTFMRWPYASICSDGKVDDRHPRGQGAFPRVLARYVREQNVLTLEEAVRRMTSLTADSLGIRDRGRIAPDTWADLVLLDPRKVADTATFDAPINYAVGVAAVWINGVVTWLDGADTGARAGVPVSKHASKQAH